MSRAPLPQVSLLSTAVECGVVSTSLAVSGLTEGVQLRMCGDVAVDVVVPAGCTYQRANWTLSRAGTGGVIGVGSGTSTGTGTLSQVLGDIMRRCSLQLLPAPG